MDPVQDLPPMTTFPTDLAAGAPLPMSNHAPPPYAEMITAAITALKDKDGSSRQAISKYIEKEYPNLPPTHSTMLTHHLKRLKNQGQLVMVKHSYMLPSRSGQPQLPASTGYHPTLDFGDSVNVNVTDANATTVGVDLGNLPSGFSKRKPGRPPKLKPVPGPGLHGQMHHVQAYDADVQSYQPQFQYQVGGVGQDLHMNYGCGSDIQGNPAGGSEPLFASLGLGDDAVVVPVPVPSPPPVENTLVVKRGRGRPPKAGGSGGRVGGSAGGGAEIQGLDEGSGRPVRKPKLMSVIMGAHGGRVKRGRGRPKRIGPVTVPLSGNLLRPRGRPKRAGRPNVSVNGVVGDSLLGSRRSGRPSINKIANLTGGRVGRPSKGGHGTAVLVTDPCQLVVYQDLKNKYELLQSKVKQVAGVVKPFIDPNYGGAALAALQELEDLAGGDTNANGLSIVQAPESEPFLQN